MTDPRLQKVIDLIHNLNEEMVANAPGASGSFGQSSPAAGPTAGLDHVMGKMRRRKKIIGLGKGSRKRWTK